jgi:4-amino-4-deoxy-L-arabinose transferase-like glycosyltransferase
VIVVLVLLLAAGVWLMAVAIHRASSRRPWSERTTAVLAYAALGWTVLAAAALAVAPLVTTESMGATSGSGTVVRVTETTSSTVTHDSLVESEGAGVLVVLLVPVAVALVGAIARGRAARHVRIGTGCVLLVLCVLGAMSIGVFYLPAPILLLVAGVKSPGNAPLTTRSAVPRSG